MPLGCSYPNQVDVAIAINVAGNQIAVIFAAGIEPELLLSLVPEQNPNVLFETLRLEFYAIGDQVAVEMKPASRNV